MRAICAPPTTSLRSAISKGWLVTVLLSSLIQGQPNEQSALVTITAVAGSGNNSLPNISAKELKWIEWSGSNMHYILNNRTSTECIFLLLILNHCVVYEKLVLKENLTSDPEFTCTTEEACLPVGKCCGGKIPFVPTSGYQAIQLALSSPSENFLVRSDPIVMTIGSGGDNTSLGGRACLQRLLAAFRKTCVSKGEATQLPPSDLIAEPISAAAEKIFVIDCFLYNGEPIAEFRLKTIAKFVDLIYVTESRFTFSGQRKPELFSERNQHIFAPYKRKVVFLTIEDDPPPPEDWDPPDHRPRGGGGASRAAAWREARQRDYALQYIMRDHYHHHFVALVSDADEVVKPELVSSLSTWDAYDSIGDKPFFFELDLYYYAWRWRKRHPWTTAFVVTDAAVGGPHGVRSLHAVRAAAGRENVAPSAGWHLRYFHTAADLPRVVASLLPAAAAAAAAAEGTAAAAGRGAAAGGPTAEARFAGRGWIEECLATGADLLGRCVDDSADGRPCPPDDGPGLPGPGVMLGGGGPAGGGDPGGDDGWLVGCRSVFVDVGSNIGVQVRKLFEPERYPGAALVGVFDRYFGTDRRADPGLCAVGIEMNPSHTPRLAALQAHYTGTCGYRVRFLTETAAAAHDGSTSFWTDGATGLNEWGASTVKAWGGAAPRRVRALDLAGFIARRVAPHATTVVMKVDVEGAEHALLPRLVVGGALCGLDAVSFEYHYDMMGEARAAVLRRVRGLLPELLAAAGCRVRVLDVDDESFLHDADQTMDTC